MAPQPAGASITPPSSVTPVNLLPVLFVSLTRLLTNLLHITGLNINPWDALLVFSTYSTFTLVSVSFEYANLLLVTLFYSHL